MIALFSPPLAEVALQFGPAEYFSLMVLGLVASIVLAHGSLLHALGMIVFGLLLGLVGTDVNSGRERFTFGMPELADGISFVVVAMGVFGLGEIIGNLEHEASRNVMLKKVMGLTNGGRPTVAPTLIPNAPTRGRGGRDGGHVQGQGRPATARLSAGRPSQSVLYRCVQQHPEHPAGSMRRARIRARRDRRPHGSRRHPAYRGAVSAPRLFERVQSGASSRSTAGHITVKVLVPADLSATKISTW